MFVLLANVILFVFNSFPPADGSVGVFRGPPGDVSALPARYPINSGQWAIDGHLPGFF
jgi:hypothetical protein